MITPVELKNYCEFSHVLKLVVLGNSNSGKTAIVERMLKNKFQDHLNPTIGADVQYHHVIINNRVMIKLQIWDVCGQVRFQPFVMNFTRGSHIIYLVFDLSDNISLSDLNSWIQQLKELSFDPLPLIVILGNKSDLNIPLDTENIKILEKLIDRLKNVGFLYVQYYEASAKTGENINKSLNDSVSFYFNDVLASSSDIKSATFLIDKNKLSKNDNLSNKILNSCCTIL